MVTTVKHYYCDNCSEEFDSELVSLSEVKKHEDKCIKESVERRKYYLEQSKR